MECADEEFISSTDAHFMKRDCSFDESTGELSCEGFSQITAQFIVRNYSTDYRKFFNSMDQPIGFEEGFIEPQSTYTNVENGLGVVYGLWESDTLSVGVTL